MRMADIKARLLRLALDSRHGGAFDAAIYGLNQKLRMVGSIKTPQDARNLQLLDAAGAPATPTLDLLADTIVQLVDPAWPLLEEPTAPAGKRPSSLAAAQPTQLTTTAVTATATAPPAKKARGSADAPADADAPRDSGYKVPADAARAFQLLRDNGFLNPEQVGAPRATSLTFRADNRARCPCCAHDHEHHNWWLTEAADGALLARSYSDRCRLTPIRPVQEIAPDMTQTQALIAQRLDLVERRQGQTELDVCKWSSNTLMDFGPHIETTLNQHINPNSIVMRTGRIGSFRLLVRRGPRATTSARSLLNPTCQPVVHQRPTASRPIVTGWVGNDNSKQHHKLGEGGHRLRGGLPATTRGASCGVEWRFDGRLLLLFTDLTWVASRGQRAVPQAAHPGAAASPCSPPCDSGRRLLRWSLPDRDGGWGAQEDQDWTAPRLQPHPAEHDHAQHPQGRARPCSTASAASPPPWTGTDTSWGRRTALWTCARDSLLTHTGLPGSQHECASSRWRGLEIADPRRGCLLPNGLRRRRGHGGLHAGTARCAAITGERLEVYACFVGAGANGKGGDGGLDAPRPGSHTTRRLTPTSSSETSATGRGPTPALAELDRKRVAVVDESNPADELNLAIVKRVTGTDVISCQTALPGPRGDARHPHADPADQQFAQV